MPYRPKFEVGDVVTGILNGRRYIIRQVTRMYILCEDEECPEITEWARKRLATPATKG